MLPSFFSCWVFIWHDIGWWCEEERAIPLKKRRVVVTVSHEKNQSKEMMKKGALEEGYDQRCNRGNGKGWRCDKMRVKGHSLCKHHLEMQRMRNNNNPGRNQEDESLAVKDRANQIRENKRVRVVKARSMSSLLRDTVPLLYY
ncbi:growth-regulating factor 7-like [Durio zibethinus]|uniref:Growth-regulating factor 7-like n=1 Tax=Durio zibethinus TaxID=66656 RepID=A0A6P6AME2_DURZI|nr:growth-regulating factor 7-like [Durio zibethinus]